MHVLRLLRGDAKQNAVPRFDRLAKRIAPDGIERVALRLYFLCHRFRPEVARWQFVVSARQTILAGVAFVGRSIPPNSQYSTASARERGLVWGQVRLPCPPALPRAAPQRPAISASPGIGAGSDPASPFSRRASQCSC